MVVDRVAAISFAYFFAGGCFLSFGFVGVWADGVMESGLLSVCLLLTGGCCEFFVGVCFLFLLWL